jgi:hypothetical protein
MRFFTGLLLTLASFTAFAVDCRYDESKPHIEITHISTAIVVGDEHNTLIRVDASGCLEVRFPPFHKRAGTHTARMSKGDATKVAKIVEDGRLNGLTIERLQQSAKASHLDHLLDDPEVMDAAITQIRIAVAPGKRLGVPVRVYGLMFKDVRPLAVEWHALQELTRTVGTLANAAAAGTMDTSTATSEQ